MGPNIITSSIPTNTIKSCCTIYIELVLLTLNKLVKYLFLLINKSVLALVFLGLKDLCTSAM